MESRILGEAARIDRFKLEQNQAGGSRLPESDRADMESFMDRVRQLLPVLGSDTLTPITNTSLSPGQPGSLVCRIKGAEAKGQRTAAGFVVFQGSTAVLEQRPPAEGNNFIIERRRQLIADGTLIEKDGFLLFTRDTEFAGPSGTAENS